MNAMDDMMIWRVLHTLSCQNLENAAKPPTGLEFERVKSHAELHIWWSVKTNSTHRSSIFRVSEFSASTVLDSERSEDKIGRRVYLQ